MSISWRCSGSPNWSSPIPAGIQEEATYLRVPCLTVRENTERPVTISIGTNVLVGQDVKKLRREVGRIMAGNQKLGRIPPLWDGQAAERIAHSNYDLERSQSH